MAKILKHFWIEPETSKRLKVEAKRQKRPQAELVRDALTEFLDFQEKLRDTKTLKQ